MQLTVPRKELGRGETSNAGLYFKLEPGWHVYWKNAGDSGEPPQIKWTLPAGITAGPLQFPAPQRLPLGPLMDFGYENEVLFPFSFDVAASPKPGPAALHAKVDWLVCREVCIPGKADLEVERTDRSAARSRFGRHCQRRCSALAAAGQRPARRLPAADKASSSPRPPASAWR